MEEKVDMRMGGVGVGRLHKPPSILFRWNRNKAHTDLHLSKGTLFARNHLIEPFFN